MDRQERTRGFLRNADWLETLQKVAQEGRTIAVELEREPDQRLREVARHIRRAADNAAFARAEMRFADRTLLGGE
jgi:hypothetical protein